MIRLLKRLLVSWRKPVDRRRNIAERERRRMAAERERIERLRADRIGQRIPPFAV